MHRRQVLPNKSKSILGWHTEVHNFARAIHTRQSTGSSEGERETSATHAHHRAHAWCGQGVWVAVPLPCCTAAASCNTAFGTLSSFVGGHHTAWESHANHQHCLCSTLFSAAAAPMLALGPHRPSQPGHTDSLLHHHRMGLSRYWTTNQLGFCCGSQASGLGTTATGC
jgi:hypothetical protein